MTTARPIDLEGMSENYINSRGRVTNLSSLNVGCAAVGAIGDAKCMRFEWPVSAVNLRFR